jgi:hypothetical protein
MEKEWTDNQDMYSMDAPVTISIPETKKNKGYIDNWSITEVGYEENGRRMIGKVIFGTFINHPSFGGPMAGRTSRIVELNLETGVVETLNSRYNLTKGSHHVTY